MWGERDISCGYYRLDNGIWYTENLHIEINFCCLTNPTVATFFWHSIHIEPLSPGLVSGQLARLNSQVGQWLI